MRSDLNTLLQLVGQSVRDPAAIAGRIVQLRWPHSIGWMGLGLVTVLTVMAISVERMVPGRPEMLSGIGGNPFVDTMFLGAMTVVFIFVLYYAGLAMGGKGTFGGTLLIMTWFQTIVLFLVIVQLFAVIFVPFLATLVSLVGFGLQLWCLLHFLNVLHGFDSLGKAFGLFALAIIGFVLGLTFILLMVGGAALVGGPV
jgi:hypothetical protein